MKRIKSHFQEKEPILEKFLQKLRFQKVIPFVKNRDRVLDLGCGYKGALLKKISPKIEDGLGVDISVTNKKIANNITLVSNKKGNIYIPQNHFDLAISLAVIEHLNNPLDLVKKVYKSLKKGGTLLITTPSPTAKPILEFLAYKVGVISKQEIKDHKKYYNKEKIRILLKNAGFNMRGIKIEYFLLGLNTLAIAKK